MAKQAGILKLTGLMGELSFYKSRYGYIARQKSGVNGRRIRRDPAFRRTRENSREFAHAARSGKLLRKAFEPVLKQCSDPDVHRRLLREMIKVLQTDTRSLRGERKVSQGELSLLQGFEFNQSAPLAALLSRSLQAQVHRSSGRASVHLSPPFFGALRRLPAGASHFRLVCQAAETDFDNGYSRTQKAESPWIAVDDTGSIPRELSPGITAGSKNTIILVLAVEYGQEVGGKVYRLENRQYNSMTVAGIEEKAQ